MHTTMLQSPDMNAYTFGKSESIHIFLKWLLFCVYFFFLLFPTHNRSVFWCDRCNVIIVPASYIQYMAANQSHFTSCNIIFVSLPFFARCPRFMCFCSCLSNIRKICLVNICVFTLKFLSPMQTFHHLKCALTPGPLFAPFFWGLHLLVLESTGKTGSNATFLDTARIVNLIMEWFWSFVFVLLHNPNRRHEVIQL